MLRRTLLLIVLAGVLPTTADASSISCQGGIVSTGDSVVDLVVKCGEPAWKESHQEELTERPAAGLRQQTYVTVEKWTYDFGPQQLLRIVTIKNGIVTDVRTGREYGLPRDRDTPKPECGDRIISTGDAQADVFNKCGEPFYRTSHTEELWEPIGASGSRKVVVTVEEWTYNFGPQRFMRIITFRNGRVVDVRTGNYGVR